MSLQNYFNNLCRHFIEEQLVYFPNFKHIIDNWIVVAGDLFDSVIIHDEISVTCMPPVQQTTLLASIEQKCIDHALKLKKSVIQATMSELRPLIDEYQIPSEEDLINCTKQNLYNWNVVTSFRRGAIQPIESFHEQKFAIETCVQSIDRYRNLASTNFRFEEKIGPFANSRTFPALFSADSPTFWPNFDAL